MNFEALEYNSSHSLAWKTYDVIDAQSNIYFVWKSEFCTIGLPQDVQFGMVNPIHDLGDKYVEVKLGLVAAPCVCLQSALESGQRGAQQQVSLYYSVQ